MALVDNTKVSNELNYHERESSYPVYHYRNVYPANGGSRTVILTSAGATQNTISNIPAEQDNVGLSYLEYTLTIDAQGAGNYAWVFNDVYGEFDSILYRDTGNQYLQEIRHLNLYNQVMNRLDVSNEDLIYNDSLNGLEVSNAPLSDVKSVRFNGQSNSLGYKEVRGMRRSALNSALAIRRKVYLKDLSGKHSFCGMAKDSLLPQETYLDIQWIGNRVGFLGTSAVDPTVGNAVLANNITISNLVLKLAVQQNPDLIAEMKQRVASGLTIPIPWVRVHTLTDSSNGASAVYNLTLDAKQHGQKVKRLIYVPFVNNASGCHLYNHSNDTVYNDALYNGGNVQTAPRISNYQTELDNRKLQRDSLRVSSTDNDDYMIHKRLLKNTTYYNQDVFNTYWVHIDAFDYPNSNDNEDGSIYVDGYELDKPTIWSVNNLTKTTAQFLNMAIVQGMKLLTISPTSFIVA